MMYNIDNSSAARSAMTIQINMSRILFASEYPPVFSFVLEYADISALFTDMKIYPLS